MSRLFGVILLLAACRTVPPQPAPPPPRAVLAIVIDQFASWQADERLPGFARSEGFGRLLREGRWIHSMEHEHGASDTALGHAALFSGRLPRELGVDRNEICRADTRRSAFVDASTQLVPLFGAPAGKEGSSLASFTVRSGVLAADELRSLPSFGARGGVIGVSLKDRASLFACGASPDFCAFFDRSTGGFVTTNRLIERPEAKKLWNEVAHASGTPHPDLSAMRPRSPDELGAPADFDATPRLAAQIRRHAPAYLMFRARPEADDAIADLALSAATLWHDENSNAPLFLAVSFSGHDYVGHSYGARSAASHEQLRRLDAALARLFHYLDVTYPGRWKAVLSSDHGVRSSDLMRLRLDDVMQKLRETHPSELPPAPLDCITDPYVRWSEGVTTELRRRYVAYWREHLPEGLGGIVDEDRDCPAAEASVCRAIIPGRSLTAHSYVYPAPDAMFDPEAIEGQGSSHGSPHLEDRTVPLLVLDTAAPRAGEDRAPARFVRYREELLAPFEGK